MESKNNGIQNVKKKIIHEARLFFIYTLFLFILFSIFNTYERLLIQNYDVDSQIKYGYGLVEAIILAKVILIGQAMELGKKYHDHALIVPIIYKTIIFSLLLFALAVIEHIVLGLWSGNSIAQIYEVVLHKKMNLILAKCFILIIIFVQFFTMTELSRALGEKKLFNLFFKRK